MNEIDLRESQRIKRFGTFLGLAKKAGKIIAGTERVTDEIRSGGKSGRICLVLLASDASENTKKRIFNCCLFYQKKSAICGLDTSALGKAIGKAGKTAAVGITDQGLANAIVQLITTPGQQGKE